MTNEQIQEQIPSLRISVAEIKAVQAAWTEAPGASEHFDAVIAHIARALEAALSSRPKDAS